MLDVQSELTKLGEGWEINDNMLSKTFTFKSYLKTMSFVNAVAWLANKVVHHPDMHVSYGKVVISMTTHDAGNSLTEKDFQLAKLISEL